MVQAPEIGSRREGQCALMHVVGASKPPSPTLNHPSPRRCQPFPNPQLLTVAQHRARGGRDALWIRPGVDKLRGVGPIPQGGGKGQERDRDERNWHTLLHEYTVHTHRFGLYARYRRMGTAFSFRPRLGCGVSGAVSCFPPSYARGVRPTVCGVGIPTFSNLGFRA